MDKQNELNPEAMRHSCAHLMAAAVQALWPGVKFGIGPVIEDGFYYDFDMAYRLTEEDLPKIEAKMRELAREGLVFEQLEKPIAEALKGAKDENQPYKKELIELIERTGDTKVIEDEEAVKQVGSAKQPVKAVSYYRLGKFADLCRGPHVHATKDIGPFKLLSVAGAYWRGSEKNPMLQRIYGTCFPTQKELDEYLRLKEEAKQRDHRKLGKELQIFLFSDKVGPGLPIYLPNGAIIVSEIEAYMRKLQLKQGYLHVHTPHIAKEELFTTSGHLQWFKESMYPPMVFEGEGEYYAKPMNCPFHIQVYASQTHSYRDLPIRIAEFGTVYRYEKSGEIGGLLRTRGFTQDDAHIFCRENQVVIEFCNVFDLTEKLLDSLGLTTFRYRLSLPGEEKGKYAGSPKQWERAVALLKEALQQKKTSFTEMPGEAAFYGPKLDILFKDCLNREWQISTIQVDFLQPTRFNLTYIDEHGKEQQPFMIHRAPLGSRERIIALLLEHYAGAFPTWLSPVQVKIIPIADRHIEKAREVTKRLEQHAIRVELDARSETMQAKIRSAQLQKVPYMLIIGDRELAGDIVSVRLRSGETRDAQPVDQFIEEFKRLSYAHID